MTKPVDRVLRRLGVIYEGFDVATDHARVKHGVTCEGFCNHCCYQVTVTTFAEALAIVKHLGQGWFSNHKITEIRDQSVALTDLDMDREKWFRVSRKPCVLLASNGSCSAYDARPIACRTLMSTENPDHCRPEHTASIACVSFEPLINVALDEIDRVSAYSGVPRVMGPLPAMIYFALIFVRNPAEAKAEIEKFYGQDPAPVSFLKRWGHLVGGVVAENPDGTYRVKIDLEEMVRGMRPTEE